MKARGSSLLEVVVALALLSIAMLGAVLVMAHARVVPSLLQRDVAARQIALDVIGRIQANPAGFRQGRYDAPLASATGSTSTAAPGACASAACSASERADADRAEWAVWMGQALPGATLWIERSAGVSPAWGRLRMEWPVPQHAWMAASEGNGCTRDFQCLRLDFVP